jgi:hypothetical protein
VWHYLYDGTLQLPVLSRFEFRHRSTRFRPECSRYTPFWILEEETGTFFAINLKYVNCVKDVGPYQKSSGCCRVGSGLESCVSPVKNPKGANTYDIVEQVKEIMWPFLFFDLSILASICSQPVKLDDLRRYQYCWQLKRSGFCRVQIREIKIGLREALRHFCEFREVKGFQHGKSSIKDLRTESVASLCAVNMHTSSAFSTNLDSVNKLIIGWTSSLEE